MARYPESPDEIFAREEEPDEGWRRPPPSPALPLGPSSATGRGRTCSPASRNTILTLLCAWLLWETLIPLTQWGVIDAVWRAADPAACRAAEGGACWAIIANKYRFILFGLYPLRRAVAAAAGDDPVHGRDRRSAACRGSGGRGWR